ncbi:hypothetical protein [Paraburkholderia caledonica]|uniref:DUF3592 domain-containing protein n=1 Tax=Paraburkholderia caledonica TaxID=134536 RepID=A0ABU1KSI8_9BURK|nr:hypothetical protein [Paraburkholderia caledonica]MDR6373917.1 hypothetical protein [Paraburkholderia caledonica]
MSFLSTPFKLVSAGGSSTASGVILLAGACLVALLAALFIRRLARFSGTKEVMVVGTVSRKWVMPEHREWQGKAYVTVPARKMIQIHAENRALEFAPVAWKYDRVSEGERIDVALQRGRFGDEIRIVDIGPF